MKRVSGSVSLQLLLLLVVCVPVYWIGLGSGGFHSTEGHRVIPAYEMLDHGHWLVPRMFEQPYLRKPPGMPWAIAGMSAMLGQTVFAARAVSALASTAMALIAFWAGRRWFGPRAGLAAGLAQALMPVLWESGRAAEIEALNHLGTQIAAFMLIDALVFASTQRARFIAALGAALGVVWFMLAKGPASVPVLIAVIASACVIARSCRPLLGVVWISLGLGGAVSALFAWLIARAAAMEPLDPVLQSPEAFLFEPGHLLGVVTLIPVAFAQSMPASLALLFPWGNDARREAGDNGSGWAVTRALAWGWLIAVGLFMLMGVRNPRYVLPAAVLIPPIVGSVVSGLGDRHSPTRERIARAMLLGRNWAWTVVLLIAAGVYVGAIEAGRRATSGSAVGERAGAAIAAWAVSESIGHIVVCADGMIEARPEVLLAIESSAHRNGCLGLEARWIPGLGEKINTILTGERVLLLLRSDEAADEAARVEGQLGGRLEPIAVDNSADLRVHKFRFRLYLVIP